MPGYLYFTIFTGLVVIALLTGPRRPRALATFTYMLAAGYNEAPFLFLFLIAISVVPEYLGGEPLVTWDWIGVSLAALLALGFSVIAWRGYKANGVIAPALDAGLGDGWRATVDPERLGNLDSGPRWAKVLFTPLVLWRRGVERLGNVKYGPDERNVLDIYRSTDHQQGSPVLIYFHSGGFYSGNKRVGSAELLHRLAEQGWLTISANYRLQPQASRYGEHLADAKRVIAWVHEHGAEYGADPSTVIVTGGSAGAHLAMVAAQSQNEPDLQPGFEEADTSVTGAVGLYGWYGGYYGQGGADSPAGPLGYDAGQAPPVFIAHGELDTVATIESARRLEQHLRAGSSNPVVFAELPGGHHGFDLFYSLRYEAVVDGIEAFAGWVRARDRALSRVREFARDRARSDEREARPLQPTLGHAATTPAATLRHDAPRGTGLLTS